MALIVSKQIKNVDVEKVITSQDKQFISQDEKNTYADKYSKNEIDNKITSAMAGLVWKNNVPTFADIATTYPEPQEGWVVTVDDTNDMYRYDAQTAAWVEFKFKCSFKLATINIIVAADGATTIPTGIRDDETGDLQTSSQDISLIVNGFVQMAGAGKDYTTNFVENELVITWNNRDFQLETSDEVEVTYTQTV